MNNTTFCINPSSTSVTEEDWLLGDSFILHGQVTAAFILFYIVVGLPWNILVVITVLRKKLYHQPTIMLLLNLMIADILMLLFSMPLMVVTGFAGEYILGSSDRTRCVTCSINSLPIIVLYDSLLIISLLSIDRFIFIYKPFVYERNATKGITLVAIAVAFTLTLAIGLVSHIPPRRLFFQPIFLSCVIEAGSINWYVIMLIVVASIALAVIVVCNICVIYIVQKNIKIVYTVQKSLAKEDSKSHTQGLSERLRKKRHEKQLHLFRVFGGLLLANLIAWLPLIIIIIAYLFVEVSGIPIWISSLVQILFFSQVAMHPVIETALISDVREPLKEMVTCGLLKKKKDRLVATEERTCCYCRHAEDHDSQDGCFLFKLINVAVLPQEAINTLNNQDGQLERVESGLTNQKISGEASDKLSDEHTL